MGLEVTRMHCFVIVIVCDCERGKGKEDKWSDVAGRVARNGGKRRRPRGNLNQKHSYNLGPYLHLTMND